MSLLSHIGSGGFFQLRFLLVKGWGEVSHLQTCKYLRVCHLLRAVVILYSFSARMLLKRPEQRHLPGKSAVVIHLLASATVSF